MFDSKYIYSSILDSNQRTSYLQETYKDLFVSQMYIYALNAAVIGQHRASGSLANTNINVRTPMEHSKKKKKKNFIFKVPISNRKYQVWYN